MLKLSFLAAFAAAAAAPAAAQTPAAERVNQLIIYGDDACPPSTDDTINVCVKYPESERYRIPENLRDNPNDPKNESWGVRAVELQYVGRGGIGSCSPVGPGGMIGCQNQLVRQARAERATRDSVNWEQLIQEAREERLSRIDADAEAVEQEEANRPQ